MGLEYLLQGQMRKEQAVPQVPCFDKRFRRCKVLCGACCPVFNLFVNIHAHTPTE